MAGVGKPLGEILTEMGLVTNEQIDEALTLQREQGGAFGQHLVTLGFVSDKDLTIAIGKQTGMEYFDLSGFEIEPEIVEMVSGSVATVYRVVPVSFENNILTVAMADPNNVAVLDDLQFLLNCDEVRGAISEPDSVANLIDRYYSGQDESIDDLIEGFDEEGFDLDDGDEGEVDLASLEHMANQPPVIKLLNYILLQAIKDRASDIHFEPFEDEFKIRYRIDGVLYEMTPPPKHLALALVSRIKVMADMNIAERRIPQDNRIALTIGGRPVDLRVATLPCFFGESVVIRVLDRSNVNLDLGKLGIREEDLNMIRQYIGLPNGIVLVTGPTGSGKTTTLYSAIGEVNTPGTKIITTEDPVEYEIDGLVQVNINDAIGLTYGSCLRAILRQDPDKIFVGEMRDKETAQIAIEAALTGHLVYSTLHTNDAPSAVTRMVDMGLEPFLVAATLKMVLAQRLVRTICPECKTGYDPTEEELFSLNLTNDDLKGQQFYYGKGCDVCNGSGYKGRTGIHEIFQISERVSDAIVEMRSTEELFAIARQEGMTTLRQAGIRTVFDGLTTVDEVVRETLATEEV